MQVPIPLKALLCGLLLSSAAGAQLPEDPGPHPVGIRSLSFSHPEAGNNPLLVRLWYPALTEGNDTEPDPAGGPYPPVLFMHGYFAPPWFYGLINSHLASHGFLVAAVGNEAGLLMNIPRFAEDGLALVHWVTEKGQDPTHFLHGMVSQTLWSGTGHSNGAAALFHIQEAEPVFGTLALMEARWFDLPATAQFAGHVLSTAGTHDVVNPQDNNARRYYEAMTNAGRNFYAQIVGGGHNGSLDFPSSLINPLPHAEQHRMHRRLVGGFLRAELRGEEDELYHLFGSGADNDPIDLEGVCSDPALWIHSPGAGSFTAGFAGVPAASLLITTAGARPPAGPALGFQAPGRLFGTVFPGTGLLEQVFPLRSVLPSGTEILIRGVVANPAGLTRVGIFQVP